MEAAVGGRMLESSSPPPAARAIVIGVAATNDGEAALSAISALQVAHLLGQHTACSHTHPTAQAEPPLQSCSHTLSACPPAQEMSCSPHRMMGARPGQGFAEAAVLAAAAGHIRDPLACKEQLPPTRGGVDRRPLSDGSDCSTEEAYDSSHRPDAVAPPRKPRLSLVLESAVAEAAPDAEALRLLRKPPKGSKRSRASRTSTPSPPVSEEGSATSTGPEDGCSRAPKRQLSREQEEAGDDAKGDPKGRRASQPWTAEEDDMLKRAVVEVGPKRWSAIALAVHGRSGKQCRLRWCNQIDPDIKHESWTDKEDATILRAYRRGLHTPAARLSLPHRLPWFGAGSGRLSPLGQALQRVCVWWTVRCSLQAQGARQPLDGDLEADPGPDGQRDQEQVERHAEPQGRGAGTCRLCMSARLVAPQLAAPVPLLGLALWALGWRSVLWRSGRAAQSSGQSCAF